MAWCFYCTEKIEVAFPISKQPPAKSTSDPIDEKHQDEISEKLKEVDGSSLVAIHILVEQ